MISYSIVISTYNQLDTLKLTLESLRRQTQERLDEVCRAAGFVENYLHAHGVDHADALEREALLGLEERDFVADAMGERMLAPAAALVRVPELLDATLAAPLCCAGWTAFGALRAKRASAETRSSEGGTGGRERRSW